MPKRLQNIFNKAAGVVTAKTSDVLTTHVRRKSRRSIKRDTKDTEAIKLSRHKDAPRDPSTKSGQRMINADLRARDVRSEREGKKRLFK